jgi:integrase|tara:strand:- start:1770 stop:3122 length:1353 start_codon:yes stop_codon:yes gene_type:complete
MGRARNRLSAVDVKNAGPGAKKKELRNTQLPDGGGLYLVQPNSRTGRNNYSSSTWKYRFTFQGTATWMGLGAANQVSLSEARKLRDKWEQVLKEGRSPIEVRRRQNRQAQREGGKTFRWCAEQYMEIKKFEWGNDKHRKQWATTLETYVYPIIGNMPVDEIELADVLDVLEPYWKEQSKGGKPETMDRVRQRMSKILGWVIHKEYRKANNVAAWKDCLEHELPAAASLKEVRNQPSLPHKRIFAFYKALKSEEGFASLALRLLILTGVRSGTVRQLEWGQVDWDAKAWDVPKEQIKGKRADQRVPLSDEAMEILAELEKVRVKPTKGKDWVFPGTKKTKCLSDGAFIELLKRMQEKKAWLDKAGNTITTHGFRSTLIEYLDEKTDADYDLKKMVLMQAVRDKTYKAYSRGDGFEKRRLLMKSWAKFCTSPTPTGGGKVIPMKAKMKAKRA